MTKRKTTIRKPTAPTVPAQVLQSAVAISTRQLLEAGAIILGGRFGFTDAQQAEWIEATAALAEVRVNRLAGIVGATNERVKENERT